MNVRDALKVVGMSLKRGDLKNLAMAYLNLKLEPSAMSSYPIMIQIEPTVHCNLECVMCANPISSRKKRHMSLSEFKKIVDGMPHLKKMSLVGAGEPLMNPELFDMITYAKSRGIMIGFATNAMLLDEASSKNILESGADWLNISIDSADRDRYEAIRKGAKLETVKKNIKRFMEMKGKSPAPDVSVWFVMMRENLTDLPDVIELSKSLGVKKVCAQLEHNWSNDKIKGDMRDRYSMAFYARVRGILAMAKKTAEREGGSFDYVNVPDPASSRACKWPWKSCYITAEGFVTPCCLQGSDPGIMNFGNIFTSDFFDIWNSPAYRDFRKALRSKEIPRICVECTAYPRTMRL
jgi:MoaA/NifB/PqqE/SkfB family radical SAM enzyme